MTGGAPWLVDVSQHQQRPRFAPLWEQGIEGAIVKMTEGTGYRDPDGVDNLGRVISSKMVPGAYHFLWGGRHASPQAKFFLTEIRKVADPMNILLFLDVEISSNMSRSQYPSFAEVKMFLHTLQTALPGKRLGIYAGYYWRDPGWLGNPGITRLELKQNPIIWDAHYFSTTVGGVQELYNRVPTNYWNTNAFGGQKAQFLQFSDKCRNSRFTGDINATRGNYDWLHKLAGGRYGVRAPRN